MAVKVSSKFQVVIPESVRDALGIVSGSKIEVIAKGGIAYLVPVQDIESLQEVLTGKLDQKTLRSKKDRKV